MTGTQGRDRRVIGRGGSASCYFSGPCMQKGDPTRIHEGERRGWHNQRAERAGAGAGIDGRERTGGTFVATNVHGRRGCPVRSGRQDQIESILIAIVEWPSSACSHGALSPCG